MNADGIKQLLLDNPKAVTRALTHLHNVGAFRKDKQGILLDDLADWLKKEKQFSPAQHLTVKTELLRSNHYLNILAEVATKNENRRERKMARKNEKMSVEEAWEEAERLLKDAADELEKTKARILAKTAKKHGLPTAVQEQIREWALRYGLAPLGAYLEALDAEYFGETEEAEEKPEPKKRGRKAREAALVEEDDDLPPDEEEPADEKEEPQELTPRQKKKLKAKCQGTGERGKPERSVREARAEWDERYPDEHWK
jgi:hypothetical protein